MRHGRPQQPRGHAVIGNPAEIAQPVEEAIPGRTPAAPEIGEISEFQVIFDTGGHAHDGVESAQVDHANLTNVTSDQHHPRIHNLLEDADHGDVLDGTVTAGDIIIGNATPKWARLAKSTNGFILALVSGLPAWVTRVQNLLEAAAHGDTVDGTVVRGDVIVGNSTPKWSRLPLGSSGQVLTVSGSDAVWATPTVGAGSVALTGAWAKDDITNLTGADAELFASFGKGANDLLSIVLPTATTLKHLTLFLNGDVGGVGDSITITVYKNGVATALAATITGAAGTEYKAVGSDSISCAALDEISVFGLKGGSPIARKLVACVWGIVTA